MISGACGYPEILQSKRVKITIITHMRFHCHCVEKPNE